VSPLTTITVSHLSRKSISSNFAPMATSVCFSSRLLKLLMQFGHSIFLFLNRNISTISPLALRQSMYARWRPRTPGSRKFRCVANAFSILDEVPRCLSSKRCTPACCIRNFTLIGCAEIILSRQRFEVPKSHFPLLTQCVAHFAASHGDHEILRFVAASHQLLRK